MLVFEEIVNYFHWISLISLILVGFIEHDGMSMFAFEEIVNYFHWISLISIILAEFSENNEYEYVSV